MALTASPALDLRAFAEAIRAGANAQFTSPQFRRLLSLPLSIERAREYTLQKSHWLINRRDCWGHAMGLAPIDVKKLIWLHEQDELAGNPERGIEDHYELQMREGAVLGLTVDDYRNAPVKDGTRTVCYAWLYLCKDTPWLKSVGAVSGQELANSKEWVPDGGMSYRWGQKVERELGIPFEKQVDAVEHAEVDVEHAHMLLQIAERHADTPEKLALMLEGAHEAWALDRTWKGLLADMLEELPG